MIAIRAIMLYLAETYGCFLPADLRYEVIQWLCFQLSLALPSMTGALPHYHLHSTVEYTTWTWY